MHLPGSLLMIAQMDVVEFIPMLEILYCKASRTYCQIFLFNGTVITHTKCLSKLQNELEDCFIKISKSAIVNKGYIRKLNKKAKTITLLNNQELSYTVAASVICEGMQRSCFQSKLVPL
jgi:DNA-binding LytR/AlgR family response regulator